MLLLFRFPKNETFLLVFLWLTNVARAPYFVSNKNQLNFNEGTKSIVNDLCLIEFIVEICLKHTQKCVRRLKVPQGTCQTWWIRTNTKMFGKELQKEHTFKGGTNQWEYIFHLIWLIICIFFKGKFTCFTYFSSILSNEACFDVL